MSNKFRRPPARMDKTQANDGVVFHIVDDITDFSYGKFRCGFYSVEVPRVRAIIEREDRKLNAHNRAKGKVDDHAQTVRNVSVFVEAVMLDWEVEGENGKPIPFSHAAAVEFFTAYEVDETGTKVYVNDFAFSKLFDYSRDILNFQPDPTTGDATGN